MEPKIYKPSIYNGAGIYKTGAEGGGGGGGGDLPEGYSKGVLKLITTAYCYITLNSSKLQINENSIVNASFFIVGGSGGWGSDFKLLNFETRQGQVIAVQFRNNTKESKCTAEFREMYNNSQWLESPLVSALSFEIGITQSLWNGLNSYGYGGRKSNRLNGNGIKSMFEWGDGSGDYRGSVFYNLTIKENDEIKHNLIPAKKSNNSVVIIDLITLDEYSVNTSYYQFIAQ